MEHHFQSLYWRNGVHFLELSMHCYLKYILNYIKILVLNKIKFFLLLYVVSKTGNNCAIF